MKESKVARVAPGGAQISRRTDEAMRCSRSRRCEAKSDLLPAQPEGLMRVTGQGQEARGRTCDGIVADERSRWLRLREEIRSGAGPLAPSARGPNPSDGCSPTGRGDARGEGTTMRESWSSHNRPLANLTSVHAFPSQLMRGRGVERLSRPSVAALYALAPHPFHPLSPSGDGTASPPSSRRRGEGTGARNLLGGF